ncbi:aminotransferase class V-fold PLP-dependent enzyme [Rufibacter glacialis]|uniref:phosphoserine transaminase n=1 Tax=Rufibacter glacialis TaxID=1259555 RepID=A0A5M8Q5B2_9BACT|nr:aminotransferase class V-fold PLP-dependent enzyme [Rufibacter glacialis]KAA6431077.1 alanine--glyoxylate aminotransferase family protein [Rufibacter glacialis]GGK83795.1 phosphoserine aminotransferase [Rufibacter glacialis]
MAPVYFTPGPAQLYPTVAGHLQTALDKQVFSQSHRSQAFKDLYQRADEGLRALFQLPQDYAIYFTGSATEIWERSLQSLTAQHTFHLVNGSFSKKYLDHAKWLGRQAQVLQKPFGQGFSLAEIQVPTGTELLTITQNETSSGVCMPVGDIHALRSLFPEPLVSVDMVSGAPYAALDFSQVDMAFFSVQKGFGLPAGLGVWLVNERCREVAATLEGQQYTGGHYSIASLHDQYQQFQTPCTPNVLDIYLLTHVVEDMLAKGIDTIRQETEAKAQQVYAFLEESALFAPFVQEKAHRSPTVLVAEVMEKPAAEVISHLKAQGLVVGSGYGAFKEKQIRIANFPAVTEQEIDRLVQAMRPI